MARRDRAARDAEYRQALKISEGAKLPGYERAERAESQRRGPSLRREKHVYKQKQPQAERKKQPSSRLTPLECLTMQDPRKPVNKSFIAQHEGACSRCHQEVVPGERVRYNPDGLLVHHAHRSAEPSFSVCDRCWLVQPCDCD